MRISPTADGRVARRTLRVSATLASQQSNGSRDLRTSQSDEEGRDGIVVRCTVTCASARGGQMTSCPSASTPSHLTLGRARDIRRYDLRMSDDTPRRAATLRRRTAPPLHNIRLYALSAPFVFTGPEFINTYAPFLSTPLKIQGVF